MDKILLVEDADTLREVLASVLQNDGYAVDAFASAEEALPHLKNNTYACVLSDFKLPGMDGIELLKAVREVSRSVPFLIMTAFGSIEIAVEAMKYGANDFICKPFEPDTIRSVISDLIEHKRIVDRTLGTRTRRDRSFIGQSASVQKVLQQAKKVAKVDTSVLILGESGCGKELLARYIHENSPRHDKQFVAVNCAAMPAELLESEFFGHEAGSFTGATQTRIGVLEFASEGTILLDEVGDMPLVLQVKLLRALQEREIKRVGSNKVIKINPRIIAATNHNVEAALKEGRLREDFYYRIAVISLSLPPLRERPQDIEVLTQYYIDHFASGMGKAGLDLDRTARDMIRAYAWPGNARELENVMERAVILADSVIKPEHLGINISLNFQALDESVRTLSEIAGQAARRAEVDLITRTLAQTMGNKSKAAQILGVSYKTLLNKVKEYNLGPANQIAEQ
ncbi:MAG: sigma-54-dependent Fis family transcriptional regulator [Deltaproteobacteria bacterium]|nr:sigma-54-dependent Fis family transcriptional regulator [Deltaproteobacteria bacterium]